MTKVWRKSLLWFASAGLALALVGASGALAQEKKTDTQETATKKEKKEKKTKKGQVLHRIRSPNHRDRRKSPCQNGNHRYCRTSPGQWNGLGEHLDGGLSSRGRSLVRKNEKREVHDRSRRH
jgi:hypothetical protein